MKSNCIVKSQNSQYVPFIDELLRREKRQCRARALTKAFVLHRRDPSIVEN